MKKILLIIVVVLIVGGGIWMFMPKSPSTITETHTPTQPATGDYKNIAYTIEGQTVLLKNGSASTDSTPGSAEKMDTEYFGNEAKGDFNSDGTQDVAFVLTQDGGGSGLFFYVVVALKTANGYQGTNAIFLGDRIAPQTTEFRNGEIIVNYADRRPSEPFSATPSVGVSKYLKVTGTTLVEVTK